MCKSYLKKSKLRKFLIYMGIPVPALKDCVYRFYRGSEWLRFTGLDDIYYEIYFSQFMAIEKNRFDEILDKYVLIDRRVYNPQEVTKLILEYKLEGDL